MMRKQTKQRTRRGYTLVELIVAVGVSSTLAVGLPSSIYIVSQSMNADNKTINRASTADIHTQLVNDLKHAMTFSELTNLAVTMNVPDRDNDSQPETIRYSWSGTPGDSLMYEYNGGTPIALATDVHAFDLSYLTRLIEAPVIPDPDYIPDSSETTETFGYESEFAEQEKGFGDMAVATRVTLPNDGILQSITAYVDNGNKSYDYYFAIYTDVADSPTELIVMTEAGDEKKSGWRTLPVTETELTAGTYWLAIGFTNDNQKYSYEEDNDGATHISGFDPDAALIIKAWLGSVFKLRQNVSIYGTYRTTSSSEPAADSDEAALKSSSSESSSSGWDWGSLFSR